MRQNTDLEQKILMFFLSFCFFQFLQSLLVCGLVLSNILMLRSFSKALQDSETTLQASVVNTASNFIFTVMTVFATYNQAFILVPKKKQIFFFTIMKL